MIGPVTLREIWQSLVEQTMLTRVGDGLETAVDAQLVQDALDVIAHGRPVDDKLVGDGVSVRPVG